MLNYLQQYQILHNLKPDGIVGKQTAEVMIQDWKIPGMIELAHFIGQTRAESNNFTAGREGGSYDVAGILKTFPKRFTIQEACAYARKPEATLNHAYASRGGNGDEASGDGWKHRGGGASQITFKNTYVEYFLSQNLPANSDPNLVSYPDHYFKSAVWYWNKNYVFDWCRETKNECIVWTAKKLNLGNAFSSAIPNGLDIREEYTKQMFITLGLV